MANDASSVPQTPLFAALIGGNSWELRYSSCWATAWWRTRSCKRAARRHDDHDGLGSGGGAAVYVCGRLSGGHINPAVTLALPGAGISALSGGSLLGGTSGGRFCGRLDRLCRVRRRVSRFRAEFPFDAWGDGRRQAGGAGRRRGRHFRDISGV